MNSQAINRKVLGTAACTAMAAVLVSGCASSGRMAMRDSAPVASSKADRNVSKAIAAAEKQTEKNPQDAAVRASLGSSYLMAGRFESAVTSFEDARYLGDTSGRTALGLALAHIGVGNGAEAVAVLDSSRSDIAVSDYGLALALAGETGRGVQILADALRGGENTVKLRQNLAYAYALDGRWSEARVMASQDVAADKLDARITEWAHQGKPEDFRLRVASMLGTQVRADEGQPSYLAIARDPSRESAALPVPSLARTDSNGELPPVENGESFWVAEATRPEPVSAPVAPATTRSEVAAQPPVPVAAAAPASDSDFDSAFLKPAERPAMVAAAASAPTARVTSAAFEQPERKSRKVVAANKIFPGVKGAASGSHLVQLGSFSSQAGAERAWSIFLSRNPELAGFDRTITQAVVGGKHYWRVSAAGLDGSSARKICTTVKNRGGGCIAWAAGAPLPGAIRQD
ncbi:MAG: SPOR domain-containing protein [Novosphingobium sp.]|nr:SPOR domain-containing protein [Novosphingobium sp.]